MDRYLFCFVFQNLSHSKLEEKNKRNIFSEKQCKYFTVTFINACLCELYLYWQSKFDHKTA